MYNVKDNIVALATTPGRSAINVIRVSGSGVKNIISCLFVKKKPTFKANYCFVANIYNPENGFFLDQSMVVFFKGPKSYTGEDLVEISTHGGTVVCKKVLDVLVSLGCRFAHKGEFSYRSFINGKIDLIQAEAIANIIDSSSEIDVDFSLQNLSGSLSKKINNICKKLKEIIVYMEHELDFNDDEIDFIGFEKYANKIKKIIKESNSILNKSFVVNQKPSDLTISIVGRPNVGKSSLFNTFLGTKRSIVTNISGTTRDLVDAFLIIEGLQVCLVDTAGIRKTKNIIEKEGVVRTEKKISTSDLVLLVDDKNPKKMIEKFNVGNSFLLIQNKIDINRKTKDEDVFCVSCKTGEGFDFLFTHLSTYIKKHKEVFLEKNSFVVSKRVSSLLLLFNNKLEKTSLLLKQTSDLSVVASSLYDAYDIFVSTTSPSNKEDIINNIFKGFCVGK